MKTFIKDNKIYLEYEMVNDVSICQVYSCDQKGINLLNIKYNELKLIANQHNKVADFINNAVVEIQNELTKI